MRTPQTGSDVQESEGEEAAESRVALDSHSSSAAKRQCRIRLHEVSLDLLPHTSGSATCGADGGG